MSSKHQSDGKLVSITSKNLPAVEKPANRWKTVDRLAADADELIERSDELRITQNISWRAESKSGDALVELFRDERPDAEDAKLSESELELVAECRAAIARLDPDELYDDEGDLKLKPVTDRLAVLVGAFPNGSPGNPEVYSRVLLEHVRAVDELSYLALDSACREVEATQKFLPSPSEVLEHLVEQQALWRKRRSAVEGIERQAQYLVAHITKITPALDAAIAARRVKEAQGDLSRAIYRAQQAKKDAVENQAFAQSAAKAVEIAFNRLTQCEESVAQVVAALVEAIADADEKAKQAASNQGVLK